MDAYLKELQHLEIQLEAIKSATGNFDHNKVIGKGGFGMVYQGVLAHSKGESMVAIKRLDRRFGQGDPEFLKEIVMLSRCKHENLITLLGFCNEKGEKILVYELASHGSLNNHLCSPTLTWTRRLKICLGAATALRHLHDPKGTQQRVLHCDIKSANILLDADWNAKVSDMGLSKIGPANQSHTFLATTPAGTPVYIDPLYMETYSITKESDVYSLGAVLFEVLCGRLCFEYDNGQLKTLLPMWKQSYEEKKLDEIIFQDLKQNMDLRSMETFSDIAYRCLQRSREDRPKMSQVVENLDYALRLQERAEEVEQPMDYAEMAKTAVPPVVCESEEELKMHLSKGIYVNGGKTWFWLNKHGEHCEMISAAECLEPQNFGVRYDGPNNSRFGVERETKVCFEFKTHVKTQFLSPDITYTVNLVFSFGYTVSEYLGIHYNLTEETEFSTYIVDKREDGWLMAELYQFTCDRRNIHLDITFRCKDALVVEGIEFQPLERVEHQVLQDTDVDMQTISHLDTTYWEQKLPSDYDDIIKWSTERLQWTTKKELYSILRKGIPIGDGEQWFSISINGKICHMVSAIRTLQASEWKLKDRSLLESRFKKMAINPHGNFWIYMEPKKLSLETTYASYLVYKLQENHSDFEPPVRVNDDASYGVPYDENNNSWDIYLLSPQTPIIRRRVYQNTHNPLSRPKMKGLPQQRNDGWMEVQIWEFRTGTTTQHIRKYLRLTVPDNRSLEGLIVQGIEFKPR